MPRKKTSASIPAAPVSYYEKQENLLHITVTPKNDEQKTLLKTISENIITFVRGYPGTGKTHVSVSYGLQQLFRDKYDQLVFTRPVVEAAGEKLGFLPGDMQEKINPYMLPIYETLAQLIPIETINKLMTKNGKGSPIRVLPLAYMRGVSFKDSFVVVDESQNTSPEQMRMLLTRIGEGCKMVICGDVHQSDIRTQNGLQDAFELLQGIEGVGFATLSERAIVRHPIIQEIEGRYLKRWEDKHAKHVA